VPLVELLLLLLLLLRAALLHRRDGPDQRMRGLRSRPHLLLVGRLSRAILRLLHPVLRHAPILRLLHVPVLDRLRVPILRLLHIPILRLRSSLLLIGSRLRLWHLPDLVVADLVVAAVGRSERPETILRLLGSCAWVHRSGLRRTHRTNQRLLIQMSAGLRLPLLNGARRRKRRPDSNDWTADYR